MGKRLSALDQFRLRRMRRFWQRRLKSNDHSPALLEHARDLRRVLSRIERQAAGTAHPPNNPKVGLPNATLWATRPDPWSTPIETPESAHLTSGTQIGALVSLYHDAKEAAVDVLQSPAPETSSSAYQLSLDVGAFDGAYLSLALGLPDDQIRRIQRTDLIRLDLTFTSLIPLTTVARANVKIGPNTETIVREIDQTRAAGVVEFDLFYAELDAQKISDVWIDLIFERPAGNAIAIRDLRLSRRPRAQS